MDLVPEGEGGYPERGGGMGVAERLRAACLLARAPSPSYG
jgi:hypothetical protein